MMSHWPIEQCLTTLPCEFLKLASFSLGFKALLALHAFPNGHVNEAKRYNAVNACFADANTMADGGFSAEADDNGHIHVINEKLRPECINDLHLLNC